MRSSDHLCLVIPKSRTVLGKPGPTFGTLFLCLYAVLSRLCHFVLGKKLTSFKLLIHRKLSLCLLRTDLLDVDLITAWFWCAIG